MNIHGSSQLPIFTAFLPGNTSTGPISMADRSQIEVVSFDFPKSEYDLLTDSSSQADLALYPLTARISQSIFDEPTFKKIPRRTFTQDLPDEKAQVIPLAPPKKLQGYSIDMTNTIQNEEIENYDVYLDRDVISFSLFSENPLNDFYVERIFISETLGYQDSMASIFQHFNIDSYNLQLIFNQHDNLHFSISICWDPDQFDSIDFSVPLGRPDLREVPENLPNERQMMSFEILLKRNLMGQLVLEDISGVENLVIDPQEFLQAFLQTVQFLKACKKIIGTSEFRFGAGDLLENADLETFFLKEINLPFSEELQKRIPEFLSHCEELFQIRFEENEEPVKSPKDLTKLKCKDFDLEKLKKEIHTIFQKNKFPIFSRQQTSEITNNPGILILLLLARSEITGKGLRITIE